MSTGLDRLLGRSGSNAAFALSCAALSTGLLFQGAPAIAQTPDQAPPQALASAQSQVYEPSFFVRFAPKTAADMVSNIPGFVIFGDDDSERGFGQARQNVLINGRRVSGKSNDAGTALGRISADTVIRIEIVDGARLDIPGLSGQVANVIAKIDAFGGSWRFEPEFRENLRPSYYRGALNTNGKLGGWSWSVGLNSFEFHNGHDGPAWIRDPSARLTDLRHDTFTGEGQGPEGSATLTYETAAGSNVNLNFGLSGFNFIGREDSFRNPAGDPHYRQVRIGEDDKEIEIGGDWELDLGPGRLKLIGLSRRAEEDDLFTLETFRPSQLSSGQQSKLHGEAQESILRAEYGLEAFGGEMQAAGEAAFNVLEVVQDTASMRQPDGSFILTPFAAGTARVEERRAETNLSYSRKLSEAWSLQGSLGVEYSELVQEGAGGLRREFVRPKGFVALVWKADPTLDISLKGERRVGQLDFGDFLASVDLQNNNARAGNADLVPEQTWIASAEINKKLGPWGAVKLTLDRRRIEDVVDQVPIGASGSGVGNLDTADAWLAGASGTINFDPIGAKGVQLQFGWRYGDSEVGDPLTEEKREISGSTLLSGDMALRWDIPGSTWAILAGLEEYRSAAFYRLDEISYNWTAPSTNFFSVENKDVFGMKMRLQVVNLNDTSENFARTVYLDGRRTNAVNFSEERHRTFGPIVRLAISGTL